MNDFEKQHRRFYQDMAFSGYVDELAIAAATKDALAVIEEAAERAIDDDLRHEEPFTAALAYLDRRAGAQLVTNGIRRTLEIMNPAERSYHLAELVEELKRRCGNRPIQNLPGSV